MSRQIGHLEKCPHFIDKYSQEECTCLHGIVDKIVKHLDLMLLEVYHKGVSRGIDEMGKAFREADLKKESI